MTLRKPERRHVFARDRSQTACYAGGVNGRVSLEYVIMSDDQKAQEAAQPVPQQAPAASGTKDTKDQPEPQHSFHDWASI